ncbi:hypothetical protein [Streptomyces sp. NPDC059452]|uniref:hypothetical protein n=1 Tax=Streptomyces sp. NPDC059452 TaxID=3346835 RepID=UPI0036A7B82A
MHQCTAVTLLPPPDHIIILATPGHRPEPGHILCELATDHPDDHATMLWDEGGPAGGAVWACWNTHRPRLVPLPWCPALDPRKEACELFADHPSPHSWDITDPTDEAITHDLARQHPHLFPGTPEIAERTEEGDGS